MHSIPLVIIVRVLENSTTCQRSQTNRDGTSMLYTFVIQTMQGTAQLASNNKHGQHLVSGHFSEAQSKAFKALRVQCTNGL